MKMNHQIMARVIITSACHLQKRCCRLPMRSRTSDRRHYSQLDVHICFDGSCSANDFHLPCIKKLSTDHVPVYPGRPLALLCPLWMHKNGLVFLMAAIAGGWMFHYPWSKRKAIWITLQSTL